MLRIAAVGDAPVPHRRAEGLSGKIRHAARPGRKRGGALGMPVSLAAPPR